MGYFIQPWHLIAVAFVGFIMLGIVLPPYWVIFKKAGHSPWLSLLTLLPVVKFIILHIVAFSEWKADPTQKS